MPITNETIIMPHPSLASDLKPRLNLFCSSVTVGVVESALPASGANRSDQPSRTLTTLMRSAVLLLFTGSLLMAQVNVRQFGATGNGTSDDAPAIRAAIAAAPAGSVVDFPPGTYRIYSSITGGQNGIILRGEGRGATVIRNDSSSHAIITPAHIRGYSITDMTIFSDPGSGDCIHVGDDFAHIRLINLMLFPNKASGVSTYDPAGTGGIDIYLESVRVYPGATIAFNIWTPKTINDVTFINAYANGASSYGFSIIGVASATLINTSADSNYVGYYFYGTSASITGATAESNRAGGFWLVGPDAYNLSNTYTWNQVSPYKVANPNADVIFLNPRSGGTPSGPALDIVSAHQVTLIGGKKLDTGLSGAASAFLSSRLGAIRSSQ